MTGSAALSAGKSHRLAPHKRNTYEYPNTNAMKGSHPIKMPHGRPVAEHKEHDRAHANVVYTHSPKPRRKSKQTLYVRREYLNVKRRVLGFGVGALVPGGQDT